MANHEWAALLILAGIFLPAGGLVLLGIGWHFGVVAWVLTALVYLLLETFVAALIFGGSFVKPDPIYQPSGLLQVLGVVAAVAGVAAGLALGGATGLGLALLGVGLGCLLVFFS